MLTPRVQRHLAPGHAPYPGLSIMAPPLAGAVGMGYARFVGLSTLSGTLWVGAALLLGVMLQAQIERLLPQVAGKSLEHPQFGFRP